jgi:NAD(P)-dependent dehydrogenase (short-subunit alcohol dehydrogenase family)
MTHGNERMKGKLCMVTGATSGIGRETARMLARTGAGVVVVGRNREKSEGTISRIRQETGNPAVEYMLADLSSQAEIRQLAESFKRQHERLDVLVNNAGGFFLFRKESVDGIEMFLALNHLAYFLLTNLLLDILKVSAPARIINVSSGSHMRATINFDDLQNQRKYIGPKVYGQSKLANVLFTYELARRLEGTGITVNALHPGFVATNMGVNIGWIMRFIRPLMNLMAIDVEEGAKTPVYLATSPEVEGVTGKYFYQCRAVSSSEASYDEALAGKLWQVSAEMTGLSENEA